MFKRKRQEVKIQSLYNQLEFFDALRSRHLGWVNDTDNPELIQIHFEIVDLIEQTQAYYHRLLELYNRGAQ